MCYLCMRKDEFSLDRVFAASPPDPPDPNAAPILPGFAPAPTKPRNWGSGFGAAPVNYGPGQGPTPITKVNHTTDPRVLWEDGQVAVIYAKDFPANSGMGRSKTRATLQEVLSAPIDDALHTAPGKNSGYDLIKVWLKDILARPLGTGAAATVKGRIASDPKHLAPVEPVVAKSGKYKGQVIPDFPHDCAACGGKCYQGMFGNVHDTPDGRCPTETKVTKRR